ncbi:type IV pilus modification PilV family protein [Pontibacter sp. JAM-7]|uniref:type IV pilus modification PilV family protein n=1 Tax=Pontibacter sp. JAM-7 TaxID=3366581 RepID=UPI003AF5C7DB
MIKVSPLARLMAKAQPKKLQSGFTLLEVLVAFMILAMSLGVIMHIFSLSLKTSHSASQQQMGMQLAQSKMAELLAEPRLSPGVQQGEFSEQWQWRAEIEAWRFPDQDRVTEYRYQPYRIRVEVERGDGRTAPLVLSTLFLVDESAL